MGTIEKFGTWISVKDRMPTEGGWYLVATYNPNTKKPDQVGFMLFINDETEGEYEPIDYEGPGFYDHFDDSEGFCIVCRWEWVSHWMPLPELPKEL